MTSGQRRVRLAAGSVLVAIALLLVFESWVTSVDHVRSQRGLLRALKNDLNAGAEGGGVAYPRTGEPVGLLEIPRVKVEQVIVEGASSTRLKEGPGHDTGTPLPGARGTSVLYGRRTTYGGPFGAIGGLRPGDAVYVTNALGKQRFIVRGDGDFAGADAQLLLATSDNSALGGRPLVVRATLDGNALVGTGLERPQRWAKVSPLSPAATSGLFRERPSILPLLAGLAVLLGAAWVTAWAYRHWQPRATFALSAPILLALLFLVFGTANRLLPSTL
jgi:sortase A